MIDLSDRVFPVFRAEWIYDCYKHMSMSDLCFEYLAIKECMEVLVCSDVSYYSFFAEFGDYLLDVIQLVMAEYCVSEFVGNEAV